MNAYQIVDFNNPVSVKTFEFSVQSLHPLRDIINIQQVQCVTPDTLPNGLLADEKKRSPTEKAALLSHYFLVKRIAEGEKILILEHDAYLRPGYESVFRDTFSLIPHTDIWVAGIAVECYTMSQQIAKRFCALVENDRTHEFRGPMLMLHVAGDKECTTEDNSVLWPLSVKVLNRYNMSCLASCPQRGLDGEGKVSEASITQHVFKNLGNTISHSGKKLDVATSPNIFFH